MMPPSPPDAPSGPPRRGGRGLDWHHGRIDLTHGAGGRASAQLIDALFVAAFDNDWLRAGTDAAVLSPPLAAGERLVMATDAHVIAPLCFPGGDIGRLAVHGTVNDVAMMGARPLYLSASFILEEGLALADLRQIVTHMAEAAREAGVAIVCGDTKVVERGKGDGVFIATTGVGVQPAGLRLHPDRLRAGDVVILSGAVGEHGLAVLAQRAALELSGLPPSDTAPLYPLVQALLAAVPAQALRVLRDPTRGGLATTLNELADQGGVGMTVHEAAIPVHPAVRSACELLGLDPLYVANEGKLVAVVAPEAADAALAALRQHPLGREAACIGTVTDDPRRLVQLVTPFGGRRVLDWLAGDPLPRIC